MNTFISKCLSFFYCHDDFRLCIKRLWLFVHILLIAYCSVAQHTTNITDKPVIDTSSFGKFSSLSNPMINSKGNYIGYTVKNIFRGQNAFVIQSLDGSWKRVLINISLAQFVGNGEYLVYLSQGNMNVVKLGTNDSVVVKNASSLKTSGDDGDWLVFKSKDSRGEIKCFNVVTRGMYSLQSVSQYWFVPGKEILLIKKDFSIDDTLFNRLELFALATGAKESIWTGTRVADVIFDSKGKKIAFSVPNERQKNLFDALWTYDISDNSLHNVLKQESNNWPINGDINLGTFRFSKDGESIYFKIRTREGIKNAQSNVDVWSYEASRLFPSDQYKSQRTIIDKVFQAVTKIGTGKVVQLNSVNEDLLSFADNSQYVLLSKNSGGDRNEWKWNAKSELSIFVISIADGKRKLVTEAIKDDNCYYKLSPDEKFIIYYDHSKKDYLSYEIATEEIRNLTVGIIANWELPGFDRPRNANVVGIAGWDKNDETLFIYDQYDIWKVDPRNSKSPVNVTQNYGGKHGIQFRFINSLNNIISTKSPLIVQAFNTRTKTNGFYKLEMSSTFGLQELTMGNYLYSWPYVKAFEPIKAREAEIYIIARMNAEQSPNYFYTINFTEFFPITNNYPEKAYNWMRSELITWMDDSRNIYKALLYKPEDFNPKKKYPIIFYFYQSLSDRLNVFIEPDYSDAAFINIPYYVSNGYLVCTPDIHFKVGKPGESAEKSIVSAAKFMASQKMVDKKRMAIIGHSFGGYEVNYILTKTDLFRCAISGAGISNLIRHYNSIVLNGISAQNQYEIDQLRIGASLWERPDLFIKNTPIFNAHKIKAPVLIIANKLDINVPPEQGIELFLALRRLGKRAWMLQYNDQHSNVDKKNAIDLTIRMKQFFDYYLKDAPPPQWMLNGVSQGMKGTANGLELIKEKDKDGKWLTPKEGGLLTNEEKKKVEALRRRKPITITLE